jgi:hypothetical protein
MVDSMGNEGMIAKAVYKYLNAMSTLHTMHVQDEYILVLSTILYKLLLVVD